MTKPRTLIGTALLAASLTVVGAACSPPDPNPLVERSGNPADAIPPTSSTTTTTLPTPTTTLYYASH
jgi:hypothetical protein